MNKPIRWSLRAAEREFRIDRRKLRKALRLQGVRAGRDRKFSTQTIAGVAAQFRPPHWRIPDAALFFGLSQAELRRRLETNGSRPLPGEFHTSYAIAAAAYGDTYQEKTRLIHERVLALEMANAKTRGDLVKANELFRVTDSIASALRWQIELLEIPPSDRRQLLGEVERLDRDSLRRAGIGVRPEWADSPEPQWWLRR
jgi:hypothetical protein